MHLSWGSFFFSPKSESSLKTSYLHIVFSPFFFCLIQWPDRQVNTLGFRVSLDLFFHSCVFLFLFFQLEPVSVQMHARPKGGVCGVKTLRGSEPELFLLSNPGTSDTLGMFPCAHLAQSSAHSPLNTAFVWHRRSRCATFFSIAAAAWITGSWQRHQEFT